jgi:murein DD-endopeptidase MepM/ murein hydrolase activator NlpD
MKTKIFDGDLTMTSPYGWRERGGVKEFHNGVDFSMVVNTPLKVPDTFDGARVRLATADSYGGKYIQLQRADGKGCYYLHVNSFRKKVGDIVRTGEVVALSGNTGLSTGPHTHFGVQSKATVWSSHEDPMPYIELSPTSLAVGDKIKIVGGDMNLRQGAGTGFTNNVRTIKQGAVVYIKDGIRTSQNVLFYGKGSTINKNDSYKWIDVRDLSGATGWIAITNFVEKAHGNTALTNFDGKIPQEPTPPVTPPPPSPVEPPAVSECEKELLDLKEQIKGLKSELVASESEREQLKEDYSGLLTQYDNLYIEKNRIENERNHFEEENSVLKKKLEEGNKNFIKKITDWIGEILAKITSSGE